MKQKQTSVPTKSFFRYILYSCSTTLIRVYLMHTLTDLQLFLPMLHSPDSESPEELLSP